MVLSQVLIQVYLFVELELDDETVIVPVTVCPVVDPETVRL